jgi:Binding-protein-dependent transport system inner membrane component
LSGGRTALNFFRSIDTLVYALLFVAAVGLGPFPGMLAVVAYTTTSLAKLYSETIEGIDPGPVDAIRATGATRLQVLRFGVLPQVLPLFLSYVLYRFESNVRAATVLGFRGRGGHRALPADLPADDRLPGGFHGAPRHRPDGHGRRLRERPDPGAARVRPTRAPGRRRRSPDPATGRRAGPAFAVPVPAPPVLY